MKITHERLVFIQETLLEMSVTIDRLDREISATRRDVRLLGNKPPASVLTPSDVSHEERLVDELRNLKKELESVKSQIGKSDPLLAKLVEKPAYAWLLWALLVAFFVGVGLIPRERMPDLIRPPAIESPQGLANRR